MWKIEDAQQLCKILDSKLRPYGWCVGLTGSLLYKGESQKDADIILYRAGQFPSATISTVKEILRNIGMEDRTTPEFLVKQAARDTKHVEIWDWTGERVDLFFL